VISSNMVHNGLVHLVGICVQQDFVYLFQELVKRERLLSHSTVSQIILESD
jgi:hypothetical protein